MNRMAKRMMAAVLTVCLLTSGSQKVLAEQKVITQDELEKLKKELQKEIDHYGEKEMEDILEEYLELFSLTESSQDKNMSANVEFETVYEEEICDVYDGSYSEDTLTGFNTEEYNVLKEKGFVKVTTDPLSTFAADVDTGSYCNLRRMIEDGYQIEEIPSGAVRTEELLNYFDYSVSEENISDGKFSLQYELTNCPWNQEHDLLLMTIQANQSETEYVGNNFVFLLDTSGSMDYAEKIALAKCSIKLLSYTLGEEDRVSIVTYSGDSYVALESCPGNDYKRICKTLDAIKPYGGTNGAGGIEVAYELAQDNFVYGGNNRVFILSDGDMNLGITSTSGLVDLISEKKETGIYLTVLGYGSGNYSDQNMESIADAGNGNYFYIDCLDEAQHVLIEKQKQTTITVAKDVKFQTEFNPALVAEYRLIGYENRDVADDDFQKDTVDGGEVGAGDQVTVLYELVRTKGEEKDTETVLKYQGNRELTEEADSSEILTVSINYKEPDQEQSETENYIVNDQRIAGEMSEDMSLAVSVAELSMLLHSSDYSGDSCFESVLDYAGKAQKNSDIYRMGYQMMMEKITGVFP